MQQGDKIMTGSDSLSVLIVDEEASILAFMSRVLEANGIRALLARSAEEAVGIALRKYVPIDLILTDVVVRDADEVSETAGAQLAARLREIRPDARVLYMSAYTDTGVIRIQMMNRQLGATPFAGNELVALIRGEAAASLTASGGASSMQ
jgi:DNA-binding NtrC family response regulator